METIIVISFFFQIAYKHGILHKNKITITMSRIEKFVRGSARSRDTKSIIPFVQKLDVDRCYYYFLPFFFSKSEIAHTGTGD